MVKNENNIENHMVLNTADAPWNQPDAEEPSAEERAESEARAARELAAAELADGFSQVAEFIEYHPEMVMPYGSIYVRANSRAEFLAAVNNLKDGGKVEVRVTTGAYPECVAKRKFGPVEFSVHTDLKNVTDALPVPAPELCPEARAMVEGK